jgi:hypothetical protein
VPEDGIEHPCRTFAAREWRHREPVLARAAARTDPDDHLVYLERFTR